MWRIYMKESETPETVTYRYATESTKADGRIIYNKETRKGFIAVPSAKDRKSPYQEDVTLAEFREQVAGAGFPEYRKAG